MLISQNQDQAEKFLFRLNILSRNTLLQLEGGGGGGWKDWKQSWKRVETQVTKNSLNIAQIVETSPQNPAT